MLNVLGAGFLSAWLRDAPLEACAHSANASGALVVSWHGCAPAMPTSAELEYFLDAANKDPARMRRPDKDMTLARLHRVSPNRKQWDEVLGFAFDHRPQFFELAQQTGASEARISKLKQLFVEAVAQTEKEHGLQGRMGVLIDGHYGQDALNAATNRGWWVGCPVELPASLPLVFDQGRSIGTTLIEWPRQQVVKYLVQYHSDHPHELRIEQEAQIRGLYDACQASGHELLLEIIVQKNGPPVEEDTVYRALKCLYNLGIYPECGGWSRRARSNGKPSMRSSPNGMRIAAVSCCSACRRRSNNCAKTSRRRRHRRHARALPVGRTIFYEPSHAWLAGEIDDAELIARRTFETLIGAWHDARTPSADARVHCLTQEQAS